MEAGRSCNGINSALQEHEKTNDKYKYITVYIYIRQEKFDALIFKSELSTDH